HLARRSRHRRGDRSRAPGEGGRRRARPDRGNAGALVAAGANRGGPSGLWLGPEGGQRGGRAAATDQRGDPRPPVVGPPRVVPPRRRAVRERRPGWPPVLTKWRPAGASLPLALPASRGSGAWRR